MNQFWPVVFPLVRPTVMLLAKVVIGLVLVSASLWGVKYFLSPGWLQAEASLQTAQAQLDEARLEQSDVQTHWPRYKQLVAAGLVGGEPRAIWVEDLLRTANELDLKDQVSFSLAVPEPVELPQAELAQASVQRHVLEIQMTQVHELEALRLIQQLQARHALVTRMAACLFAQTGWQLPEMLDRPLQVLAAALGPMALLLVGIALAHTRIGNHWRGALRVAVIKNLALPATLGTLAWALGLSGPAIAVMFTAAAMPVGANVLLFTQRYGVMQEEVSSAIALSTALALITLPVVLVLAQFFMH